MLATVAPHTILRLELIDDSTPKKAPDAYLPRRTPFTPPVTRIPIPRTVHGQVVEDDLD